MSDHTPPTAEQADAVRAAIADDDLALALELLEGFVRDGLGPAGMLAELTECQRKLTMLVRDLRREAITTEQAAARRVRVADGVQSLLDRCLTPPEPVGQDDPVPDLGPPPAVEPDELVVRRFVGRADEVGRVLAAVRRQKVGQKKRPRDVPALFWYHGFGGMGKSWLIRRLAYEASRPRRGKAPRPWVLLVDWNPGSARWNPLRTAPDDPAELFRGIATRVTQVCGRGPFGRYWAAAAAFRRRAAEWTDLCTRLRQALAGLRPGTDPDRLVVEPGPDRFPVRFTTPEAEHDRMMLEQVLRTRHQWPAGDRERADCLARVGEPGATWEEVYEAWADDVATPGLPERDVVVRPYSFLADTLRAGLEEAAQARPLFLLLDTCEQLNEWADGWLQRLLVPLLTSPAAAVVVVGSRSRPDRYHVPGQQGGWRDELAGRITPIPFDRERHFTVTEVADLLRRAKASVPGTDPNDLAVALHAITHGVPLGLSILLDEPELLREIAGLADLGGNEMDTGKAARRVIEEVAARFLQHVADPRDRDDLFALTLLPGSTGGEDPDLEFRPRARRAWPDGTAPEGYRVRALKVLFGDPGWRPRLETLERRYALVADGDLHSTVRHYFRARWRDDPPDGLAGMIDRLAEVADTLRPSDGVYDHNWMAYSAWRIELDGWRRAKDVAERLALAAVVGRAHGLDTGELRRVAADFGGRADGVRGLNWWGEPDTATLANGAAAWPEFERACLALLDGEAKAQSALTDLKVAGARAKLAEAVDLLQRALDRLWPTLTDGRRRELAEVYLHGVTMLTTEGERPQVLERAVDLARRLPLPVTGVWWATLLHNQGLYEESCVALRKMMESTPDDPALRLALVHNLGHHLGQLDEAMAVAREAADRFDGDLRFAELLGNFLGRLGRLDEGITTLRTALDGVKWWHFLMYRDNRPDCHVTLGQLYAQADRLPEAEAELRKALELEPDNAQAIAELVVVLDRQGRSADALAAAQKVLASKANGSEEWYDLAGSLAWSLYVGGTWLGDAEGLAERYIAFHPHALGVVQTLFAVHARAGNWEAADPHLCRYIREYPPDDLFGGQWKHDVLFFRDVVKAGRERELWVAERIAAERPEPRDDRWEVVRLALTDPSAAPERLRPAALSVCDQFRSTDPAPTFPPIPSPDPTG